MVGLAALALLTVTPIDQAFDSMYNSDFSAAQRTLNGYIAEQPEDPLGYCVRAAAYLFGELDRLLILDGEFFADDKRIAEKKKLRADPNIRNLFYQAVADAEARAKRQLAANPNDRNALFALCISSAVVSDYLSLLHQL